MINIKQFCATDDTNFVLNEPFKIDCRVVATNRHVMIITQDDGDNDFQKLPDDHMVILETIKKIEAIDQWQTLTKDGLTFPELRDCGVCKGKGKAIKEDCAECNGEGETEASNDYSTYCGLECQSCGGGGYKFIQSDTEICPDCRGEGNVYPRYSHVSVFGGNFQANYLRLIINEPDLEINVDVDGGILFFKTPGYIGAIMGVRV